MHRPGAWAQYPGSAPRSPEPARCQGRDLLVTSELTVSTVDCVAPPADWLHGHASTRARLVLVRSGSYLRRLHGRTALVDATQGYLLCAGEEELIQHIDGGGHRSTVLAAPPAALPALLQVRARLTSSEFRTTSATDLARRRLVAACLRGADANGLAEAGAFLLGELVRQATPEPRPLRRQLPASALRVVDLARRLAIDPSAGATLDGMATAAGVSPEHLTRVFKQSTGLTIGRYRNRVRVRLALEWLAEGEDDLTRVAHALGFADHAHFSRTVLREIGVPPSVARALLNAPPRSRRAAEEERSAC